MSSSDGAPLDDLTSETIGWVKSLGLNYTKLSEIIAAGPCPKVRKKLYN